MKAVIQRVSKAKVEVDARTVGSIGPGLLVLLGVEEDDGPQDLEWMERKIPNLRIFSDDQGKMNLSLLEVKGSILLVSQFTLLGDTKKGNRPSFIKAAAPEKGQAFYEELLKRLSGHCPVQTGSFGAMMEVSLINDGPVTILLDSKA